MFNRNTNPTLQRNRRDRRNSRTNRRRWHTLERLESRCVLSATLSGQVFEDLNGDQLWQNSSPDNEPALDCWTVYLDNNQNGILDEGEPQKLTSADGSYSFNVAAPGDYSVELVQDSGYDRTKPIRFGLSTTLVAGAAQDHVFDPTRSVLYTTDGNQVQRTDPQTGQALAGLAFGSALTAIDITPDGKYLLVGESATAGGAGKLFKIDLSTNAVTPIDYTLVGQEGGVFDVAAVSNDRVLFTTTSSTSDRVQLREVNLTTNAVTTRAETFGAGAGAGEVQPDSRLERNSARTSLLLVQSHDAAGPVYLYESDSNTFVRSADLADTLDDAHLAISRDGKHFAIQSAGLGLQVFDEQFALVTTLTHFRGGIAFDSVRNILYAGDTDNDQLVAIDTNSWGELYRVAVGEDLLTSGPYHEMQVSDRAKFLSMTTTAGMRYVQLDRAVPYLVTVAENQVIDDLDFGNWANGENRRPTAVGDNYSVAEDETLSISAPGVLGNDTDPDGNTLVAQFVEGPQHGVLTGLPDGSFTYSAFSNYFGGDSFTYRAYDGALLSCRTVTANVNVTSVNDAPTDITLSGSTVDENVVGANIGQVAVVDADVLDQFVFQVSDSRFEIVNGQLRLVNLVSLDHEQSPTIDVTITATDTGSPPLSISETFTIQVNDVNEFDPTVDTTTVETPEGDTTVGTVQTHDNDSSQTLEIVIIGGNDGGIFSIDSNTGIITVNTGHELDFEGTQIYVLTVSVSDNVEPRRTTTADVTITVTNVNESDPVMGSATFEIAENSPDGTAVGTVVATDADAGQTLVYSITGGNDGGAFDIDSATGAITVADGSQLDREQTAQFVLTVQATDNGSPPRSGSGDVTINLTDVNEFEPIVVDQIVAINENTPNDSIVVVVLANDPDAAGELVYSISDGNAGGAFSIDSQSGEIKVADSSALDFETTQQFVLEIDVTEVQSPSRSAAGTVTIDLRDVNEFDPAMSSGTFDVPADAAVGFELGTISATDLDRTHAFDFAIIAGNDDGVFTIDPSSGVITVADNADLAGAVNSQYVLTVSVDDNGIPNRSANADVAITVVPGNTSPPTANDAVFSLAENSANGTVVGSVSATDPDSGSTLSYSITAGNENGVFAIDAASGQITVADSGALDYDSVTQFTLTVLVSDGGTPSKTDEAEVTINLTDVNEFTPAISDAIFSVQENAADGTVVGSVAASDSDAQQTVTYSISGSEFAIHPTTGVITVANSGQLNFEATTAVVVSVTATDSGNPAKSASANVTVNLSDVNEASPVVPNHTFNINENPLVGAAVGQITATDADTRQTLIYSFSGGNVGGAFAINPATGEITVATPTMINAEALPQFLLLVFVTDGGTPPRAAAGIVTVNVREVNEPPVGVLLDRDLVSERVLGATVGLVAVLDPDAGDQHTFAVDDGRFTVDANHLLKLKADQELDSDDGTEIPIKITATDSGGLSTSQNLVIHVVPNPKPWQNPDDPLDVNGDGQVTPGDVLLVINEINLPRTTDPNGNLPNEFPDIPNTPYYDVNGDGVVSPIDVLIIINELNRRAGNNQAEGEAGFVQTSGSNSRGDDLVRGESLSNFLLPPVSSLEATTSATPATRRHHLNELEAALDDLAADIATVWGIADDR